MYLSTYKIQLNIYCRHKMSMQPMMARAIDFCVSVVFENGREEFHPRCRIFFGSFFPCLFCFCQQALLIARACMEPFRERCMTTPAP